MMVALCGKFFKKNNWNTLETGELYIKWPQLVIKINLSLKNNKF